MTNEKIIEKAKSVCVRCVCNECKSLLNECVESPCTDCNSIIPLLDCFLHFQKELPNAIPEPKRKIFDMI